MKRRMGGGGCWMCTGHAWNSDFVGVCVLPRFMILSRLFIRCDCGAVGEDGDTPNTISRHHHSERLCFMDKIFSLETSSKDTKRERKRWRGRDGRGGIHLHNLKY